MSLRNDQAFCRSERVKKLLPTKIFLTATFVQNNNGLTSTLKETANALMTISLTSTIGSTLVKKINNIQVLNNINDNKSLILIRRVYK